MKQVQPDVWQTELESPFPGLTTHAYLLTRARGNVLFYNTGHDHEIDRMAELGGVHRQYLSHLDELGASLNTIAERYGSLLGGHEAERADFAKVRAPDILFRRHEVHDGIEVIPTPGHTPGSTCFLATSSTGRRYLFTGDTLYLSDEGWRAGLLPGSDRAALTASLEQLRALNPDVVFSSAFAGEAGFAEIHGDWAARVDEALARM